MRLVLLGPPGAGKGTQARFLVERLGAPHISTGEMLRAAIRRGTGAGVIAREIVEAGRLVPDDVMRRLVEERLAEPDGRNGFILDGYPRNLNQAKELEEILQERGGALDRVVELTLPAEVVVSRLSGRRTCTGCGTVFHVEFNRPRQDGVCDRCGDSLVQREDDREETIRRRIEVYEENTRPLVQHYRDAGLLSSVRADRAVEEVAEEIRKSLEAAG